MFGGMIDKIKILNIIKDNFEEKHKQLSLRPLKEQTVIGDLLTTLELEIKKEIKALFSE